MWGGIRTGHGSPPDTCCPPVTTPPNLTHNANSALGTPDEDSWPGVTSLQVRVASPCVCIYQAPHLCYAHILHALHTHTHTAWPYRPLTHTHTLQDWNPAFPVWPPVKLSRFAPAIDESGLDLLDVRWNG